MTRAAGRARPVVAVGLSLAVLVAVFCSIGIALFNEYRLAIQELQRIEPRYARLAGLELAAPRLDEALNRMTSIAGGLAYPESIDAASAGAEMQQRLRRLAESTGSTVAGSQIRPVRKDQGGDEVSVVLSLEAGLPALQKLLAALRKERPLVRLEAMTLEGARNSPLALVEQRLLAQLVLSARKVSR